MGQTRGDVFRFYVNQIVDVDTQSIFLETPSRNALLKLSSNSGLTRDPSAPQHLTDEQKNSIRKNPEILELEHQRGSLRKGIIAKYNKICLSRGTPDLPTEKEIFWKTHPVLCDRDLIPFHDAKIHVAPDHRIEGHSEFSPRHN